MSCSLPRRSFSQSHQLERFGPGEDWEEDLLSCCPSALELLAPRSAPGSVAAGICLGAAYDQATQDFALFHATLWAFWDCKTGMLPGLLSFPAAQQWRWPMWQEGYYALGSALYQVGLWIFATSLVGITPQLRTSSRTCLKIPCSPPRRPGQFNMKRVLRSIGRLQITDPEAQRTM